MVNSIQGKKFFVAQLTAGQQVHDLFLVARKSLAETKSGKPYLALALLDKTGEIEARVWENALQYDSQAEEGAFVLVQAIAKPFRDQLQLVIASLAQVKETAVSLVDFMPASVRSPEEMGRELAEVVERITDVPLRALLREIFQGEVLTRFSQAPAAKKMHHAYLGGLIEHTLSIVGMAEKTASHYPLIDRNMLIAGALLHDLAKIEEFDCSRLPFSYTDRGRLVGHLVLGVEMVRRAAESVADLPPEQLDQLMHIILSHHGQLAFGSPVLPMTPEAILLHHLDDMDAKMNYMEGLRAKLPGNGWKWTDYQRPLERFLFLRGSGEEPEAEDQRAGSEPAGQLQEAVSKGEPPVQRQQTLF